LLVVADGALQYSPFAALPSPAADHGRSRWLAMDHELISIPSASVLGAMRRQLAGRPPASKAVAVLADPVFDGADRRVMKRQTFAVAQPPAADTQPAEFDLKRAVAGIDATGRLPRLPFTRREADSILELVPARSALKAVDFAANRAMAISGVLTDYRIVHIATHAVLNTTFPELSGVVLSLIDSNGQPQDGFLRLQDIYNLDLPADLVVLSACQTGLGQDIKGEGLIGLTRGFMYAGAAGVVVSLWKVDDEATAALMKLFYTKMLKFGVKPDAALRMSQMELARQPRWQSPYYWAAFVVQGNYE